MTVKQLLRRVRAVTGEGDYVEEESFIDLANTALSDIFSEIRPIAGACIHLSSPKAEKRIPLLRHSPGTTEHFPLVGVAYSFKAFGKGAVRINDGGIIRTHEFDGYGIPVRGLIKNGGTLDLTGELAYTVKDLAFFSELLANGEDDIPLFGEPRRLSLTALIKDFSIAVSPPADKYGAPVEAVVIETDTLVAAPDFSGDVYFSYKRTPPRLTLDDTDAEIRIPRDANAALVDLTAAYILTSMESDRATFFAEKYARLIIGLKDTVTASHSVKYQDVTRWA